MSQDGSAPTSGRAARSAGQAASHPAKTALRKGDVSPLHHLQIPMIARLP